MTDINIILSEFLSTMSELDSIDLTHDATTVRYKAFLAESLFLAAWRSLEQLLAKTFFHYCCGGQSLEGIQPNRFVLARDQRHAESLIRGERRFVEWNSASDIVRRAEDFFEEGGPIKPVITAYRQHWVNGKSIRNHIAHGSSESREKFLDVIRNHLNTVPPLEPSPGDLLLKRGIKGPEKGNPIIELYLSNFKKIGHSLCSF